MKNLNYKIICFIVFATITSCKKIDHSYEYHEYTSLDRIEINDTIVGPDILTVFTSEDAPGYVDSFEFKVSSDTVYVDVVKTYCNNCYPNYNEVGFNSNLGNSSIMYYNQNSKRIEMEFWPVHNGNAYLSYLHTSGERRVKKIFISRQSSITGWHFDPPNLFSGDTIFLDDTLGWGHNISSYVSYYSPLINTPFFGDTIKDIYGGVCGVNEELNWGAFASSEHTSIGTSYGIFYPKDNNTKLRLFIRLGSSGRLRIVDDTTITVNFHCVFL